MATHDHTPEGYLGNLNEEHEGKLRQLWSTVFKLYDLYESKDPELQEAIKNCGKQAQAPAKSRFGFFKGAQEKPAANNIIEKYLDLASNEDDSKYNLRKRFMEMIGVLDAGTLRKMIVEAVKGDHPDALVLRFLRARKWDPDAALVMMVAAMDWRYYEAKVDSEIMRDGDSGAIEDEKSTDPVIKARGVDFMRQLRNGKGYLHGVDRKGQPISCVRVRLHKPFEQKTENLERFIIYLIETGRFALDPPVETCCLIFDLTGFTLANMDYVPLKFIIKCFEANYPESLGYILIHNAPWVFKSIWGMIRGWLDPVVANKVNFTYSKADLEVFIAPDQLIKELGGDEDWEYKYIEPVAGENDLMKDEKGKEAVMAERNDIADKFEAVTRKWIATTPGPEADKLKQEREDLAKLARANYWKLDPYVRARSMYDREGSICGGAKANWYKNKPAAAAAVPEPSTEEKAAEQSDKTDETAANATETTQEKDVFVDATDTKGVEAVTVALQTAEIK